MLILLTERAPTGGSQGTIMDHFGFKVNDIEPFLTRWRAAGYEVQSEFLGAEGFPNAYLMGPDSVRIELQEDRTQREPVSGYHIHFFTPEYRELMAWYVDIFGVEPFERGTIATTANAPGMNLSFGNARAVPAPTRGRAIDHIGFEFTDLDAFVRQLEAKGITLDVPLREVPNLGLKIAFLTDPSGVYVELTEGLVDY
jgi:catechol 2,3-dioxygenase-like lactoylglutathione lyase family enzyme